MGLPRASSAVRAGARTRLALSFPISSHWPDDSSRCLPSLTRVHSLPPPARPPACTDARPTLHLLMIRWLPRACLARRQSLGSGTGRKLTQVRCSSAARAPECDSIPTAERQAARPLTPGIMILRRRALPPPVNIKWAWCIRGRRRNARRRTGCPRASRRGSARAVAAQAADAGARHYPRPRPRAPCWGGCGALLGCAHVCA